MFMTDNLTDKLLPNKCKKIVFKYSRLFCDVERFKEKSKETMSEKGMGVIYTNDCFEQITMPNKKYEKTIIKSYYDKHHKKLDKITTQMLNKDKCIIIDFHSFSDEMVYKLLNIKDSPDICIGTDQIYTPPELLNFTLNFFKKYGYSVKENYPYSGTIVPSKFMKKHNNKLSSIMIEINKRVYLNDKKKYLKLKKCIEDYNEAIKESF